MAEKQEAQRNLDGVVEAPISAQQTIETLTGKQLNTLSAEELINALGGMGDFVVTRDGFYSRAFAAAIKAQQHFPLMIATPENWRAPFPYKVSMQANGMTVTIEADKLTLVPQTFYEIWMNKVQGEAQLRGLKRNAAARLNYTNSRTELPDY